jgi:serine phosphatase RsbU (regulator of sigma subunit)
MLNAFFTKLFDLGIDGKTEFTTAKKIRLVNSMAFMVVIAIFLHQISVFLFKMSILAFFHPLVMAAFAGVIWLNAKKQYKHAITLLFTSFIISLFIFGAYSFYKGEQNVSKYAIFPFCVLSFFFIDNKKIRLAVFWFCGLGFIILNYFQQYLAPAPHTTYWAVMVMILLSFYLCLKLFEAQYLNYGKLLEAKNVETVCANTELNQQKEELEKALVQITDSVRYAKRIQQAILPNRREIEAFIQKSFVFYQPKGIVSGDFYWFHKLSAHKAVIAVGDCTGHGVPGAFMTIIGNDLLQQIIAENHITEPRLILKHLDDKITTLLVSDEASKLADGMDISVVLLDLENELLTLAAAQRTVLIYTYDADNQPVIHECKGDKFPIGGYMHQNKVFTQKEYDLKYGASVYLFTDGVTDTFGWESNKKLGLRRLREWLEDMQEADFSTHRDLLIDKWENWQGSQVQIDDVLLLGFQVPKKTV